MRPIDPFVRKFDALMYAFCTVFAVVFGVLTLLICVDIVFRRFGMGSMPWLIEVIEYVMYGGTFLTAPWVLRQGEHVRVDLLLSTIPKAAAIVLEQFVDALGALVTTVMAYHGTLIVIDAYRSNFIQYKNLAVHDWILLLPIPIGCAMLAIEFVLRICRVRGSVEEMKIDLELPGI
jgi:TRAP-type C4-dicarboxylate transport system permease small subunit